MHACAGLHVGVVNACMRGFALQEHMHIAVEQAIFAAKNNINRKNNAKAIPICPGAATDVKFKMFFSV